MVYEMSNLGRKSGPMLEKDSQTGDSRFQSNKYEFLKKKKFDWALGARF